MTTFTVYKNNKKDQPLEVSVDDVIEKIEELGVYPDLPPEQAVNFALAKFGSFDPQSEEYKEFETEVSGELLDLSDDALGV